MSLYDLFIYFLCPIFGYVECDTATGNEERTMTIMLMFCGDALLDGDQDHNHLRDVVRGLEREGDRVVKVNKSQHKKSFELDQKYC